MMINLLVLLLTLWGTRPLPAVEQTYHAYLPIIFSAPRPLVEDTRPGPEVCMAWSPGNLVEQARQDFGMQLFFNSGSHQPTEIERGGVPVWRSPNIPDNFLAVPATLRYWRHTGLVLLFNEPDVNGQDAPLSPEDAASLYRLATQLLPGAVFITPNALSVEYLRQFLTAVGDDWRPQDIIGVHLYQPPTDQLNGTWVYEYPTIWPADWLRPVLALAAERGSQVWVSEVGIANSWTLADMQRYVRELDGSGAQVVCWYTPHCGGYSQHACLHNLYSNASGEALTPAGATLKALLGQ